jgi:hypothetical protein
MQQPHPGPTPSGARKSVPDFGEGARNNLGSNSHKVGITPQTPGFEYPVLPSASVTAEVSKVDL